MASVAKPSTGPKMRAQSMLLRRHGILQHVKIPCLQCGEGGAIPTEIVRGDRLTLDLPGLALAIADLFAD